MHVKEAESRTNESYEGKTWRAKGTGSDVDFKTWMVMKLPVEWLCYSKLVYRQNACKNAILLIDLDM